MRAAPCLRALGVLLVWSTIGGAAAAQTWQASGGWVRSDVGLHQDGDGLTFGVARVWPLGSPLLGVSPLELTAALEYVQRAGSQPMIFSDPVTGSVLGEAEVTLHCVQPTMLVGATLPVGRLVPRVFVGGAAALKVSEEWRTPPGTADRDLGYEDLDLLALAGLAVGVGPVQVEARFCWGLTDQVTVTGAVDGGKSAAAEDPLQGVRMPQPGERYTGFQVAAGWRF